MSTARNLGIAKPTKMSSTFASHVITSTVLFYGSFATGAPFNGFLLDTLFILLVMILFILLVGGGRICIRETF